MEHGNMEKETGMRHFECVSDAVRPWFSPVRYLHVWNYFGDTIWGGSVGYAPPLSVPIYCELRAFPFLLGLCELS